jgi:hypothetical protein
MDVNRNLFASVTRKTRRHHRLRRVGLLDPALFSMIATQAFECLLAVADRRGCDHAHPAFGTNRSERTLGHAPCIIEQVQTAEPEFCGLNTSYAVKKPTLSMRVSLALILRKNTGTRTPAMLR